jgi:hypothetical protein
MRKRTAKVIISSCPTWRKEKNEKILKNNLTDQIIRSIL